MPGNRRYRAGPAPALPPESILRSSASTGPHSAIKGQHVQQHKWRCHPGRALAYAECLNVAPLCTSWPGITAAEPVAGIVLGIVVFGDRIRVSPGFILLEASGLIALLITTLAAAQIPPIPGFALRAGWKMLAAGSWRVRRGRGVGHGCG